MPSERFELHRTLVQLLIDTGQRELAAVMIDGGVEYLRDDEGLPYGLAVDIPTTAYGLVSGNDTLTKSLRRAVLNLLRGRVYGYEGRDPIVELRVKLVEDAPDWYEVTKELIARSKGNNQGTVSRLMRERDRKEMLTYNEASYACQSEKGCAKT